ncbi:serum amyloid P-component-like isoform X2 [Poecilia formosa]|uniref:serum amyloid P-component-like isoform X2 n=1 Tax=Poecilia formosa TaxID=48698 RepID=UPI0007B7ABDF|nr:PREDICTED: serum amyloid P-component-like isoform X2 [Poecilia formosa]
MLFFLLLVTSCAATPQNLQGKMFTFPEESNTANVRLTTSKQDFNAVTVCFRFLTDLSREFTFFSLSVPSFYNGVIFKNEVGSFQMCVNGKQAYFRGLDFKLNKCQSLCGTWEAASGLTQLWLNGQPSSRRLSSKSNISGPITITLGQEQDRHGGFFESRQSFVGMMTDVHMWDSVLSPCEIKS